MIVQPFIRICPWSCEEPYRLYPSPPLLICLQFLGLYLVSLFEIAAVSSFLSVLKRCVKIPIFLNQQKVSFTCF